MTQTTDEKTEVQATLQKPTLDLQEKKVKGTRARKRIIKQKVNCQNNPLKKKAFITTV